MASLNQYASRVAHLVGQPDNHSLKERIKDMIKDYFAKYIVQSIDKNGIQPYYKLTLEVDMIGVESSKVINPNFDNDFYIESADINYKYHDHKGVPVFAEVSIKLKEYIRIKKEYDTGDQNNTTTEKQGTVKVDQAQVDNNNKNV